MSDDASHCWDLDDSSMFTYFNRVYPQIQSWQLCHPSQQLSLAVSSMICRMTLHMEYVPPNWFPLTALEASLVCFLHINHL
jgi:hypothetical protein